MKRYIEGKRHVRLWVLMVLSFTLILTLITAAIILTYRAFIRDRYEEELHQRLTLGRAALAAENYSREAIERLSAQGLHLLLVEEGSGEVLYRDAAGLPLRLGPKPAEGTEPEQDPETGRDAENLREAIQQNLGDEEGSFYASDSEQTSLRARLQQSTILYLCGRDRGLLYCLYLPVESTNAAINLAVRYATAVSLVAWLISLFLLYWLSRLITRPHRKIAATAAKIAKLDFSRRCPPALTAELNELSQSINAMSDSLEENVNALRDANAQLQTELAERTRQQQITSDLIANLSHDLKTPIAIISGYAEGLQEGVARTPEKQQSYYEMILRESEHMQDIVSRILSLGRMESGETPIVLEDFDESFQLELERGKLDLALAAPKPCMVRSDYTCTRQSLQNYIQNAVYHINEGNRIRVFVEDGKERVRVRVTNSSAPIPEDEARKLWDKLYRRDVSRQRHNGEMGLGLSIVKGNMERLGNAYGFENDPFFPGVSFWLELPKSKPQEPAPEEAGTD